MALAHDYLNQTGGAERVVGYLHELFPEAPIYTSFYVPEAMPQELRSWDIRTSFIQRLQGVSTRYRRYLPLYPLAFGLRRMEPCDLVLTSSATFAQGIRVPKGTPHIVYCHTPMRFVWETEKYFATSDFSALEKVIVSAVKIPIKAWDYRASQRVTAYIANSKNTQAKIARFYRRDSEVIYPPIDADRFSISPEVEDYFLIVSRLVHQKNTQLAIQASSHLKLPLKIVGRGPFEEALRSMAGPAVEFLGYRTDDEVARLMSRCRALMLPGEEDLGLTPLEANASGRPVIALGTGGALETVIPGKTGILFPEPTIASLLCAVEEFSRTSFNAQAIRAHALRFDVPVFKEEISVFLAGVVGK